jgi:hypothetical protein
VSDIFQISTYASGVVGTSEDINPSVEDDSDEEQE